MGKRYSVEDSTDKLRWGWITVAGDTESCWGFEFLFMQGMKSVGYDLSVATSLGTTF